MRVGYYVNEWPPKKSGGILTYLSHLTDALNKRGHEIYFITHHPTNSSFDNVIPIEEKSSGCRLFQRFARRMSSKFWFEREGKNVASAFARAATQYHLDLIEMEESFGWGAEVTASTSVPVVIRIHGPWKRTRHSQGLEPSKEDIARIQREEKACKYAKAISGPSRYALDSMEKITVPDSLCRIIPNGMILPAECWNFSPHHQYKILFVGRFDKMKGADLALQAFAKLATPYPQCELHLVGPDLGITVGSDKKKYLEFLQSSGLTSLMHRIHFYGELDPKAIHELRLNSGVTLVASRMETFPYAAIEAMSYGCPLVALRIGGIPELIEHNRTGLLADYADPMAIAEEIKCFFDHPGEAERIGKNARQEVVEKYNIETFAQSTITFYKEVIAYYQSS